MKKISKKKENSNIESKLERIWRKKQMICLE